ncbi:hypothetical protein [Euzebya sp.]|uniref:hypothetical protein n=1 Tax=Euzebya sp. TaxID=1971409 RepID=UPI0035129133
MGDAPHDPETGATAEWTAEQLRSAPPDVPGPPPAAGLPAFPPGPPAAPVTPLDEVAGTAPDVPLHPLLPGGPSGAGGQPLHSPPPDFYAAHQAPHAASAGPQEGARGALWFAVVVLLVVVGSVLAALALLAGSL